MAENNAINKQTEDLIIDKAAGDPFVNFQIGGTDEFVIGVDDSDGDSFKINQGGTSPSGGTNTWTMTSAGERTMPVQPAFLAYVPSNIGNVTGNGTAYTVAYSTEVYDQGGDYNNGTYTFTAPATGRYELYHTVQGRVMTAANILNYTYFATSNRSFYFCVQSAGSIDPNGQITFQGSILCDMDSADTAYVVYYSSGAGLTVGVAGNANPANSMFSGVLMV